jgi:hypothetical protein
MSANLYLENGRFDVSSGPNDGLRNGEDDIKIIFWHEYCTSGLAVYDDREIHCILSATHKRIVSEWT